MNDDTPPTAPLRPPGPEAPPSGWAKLIRDLTSSRVAGPGDAKGTKNTSILAVILGAAVVAIILAVLGFALSFSRRKAALLEHETAVREEEARETRLRADEAAHAAERLALSKKEMDLRNDIVRLRHERALLEEKRVRWEAAIKPVTSWDDLDVVEEREVP